MAASISTSAHHKDRRFFGRIVRIYGRMALIAGAAAAWSSASRPDDPWPPTAPGFKSAGVSTACSVLEAPEGRATAEPSREAITAGYACALPEMLAGYAAAGVPSATAYATWTNYARHPYLSATHAGRYVNNYANDVAADYGRYQARDPLPVVLAGYERPPLATTAQTRESPAGASPADP